MNFKDWVNGQRGRSLAIAQALGVTPPVVSDWVTGKKGVPLERCVQIERATNGEVRRQDLRPDDWQDIWPELAFPRIDIAQAAIEAIAINSVQVQAQDDAAMRSSGLANCQAAGQGV